LILPPDPHEEDSIWIHALSVGEIISAIPLIKSLKQKYPSRDFVFTVTTSQGMKVAREELEEEVEALFTMPLDFWWSMQRVVRYVKPSIFILVETDIWPGLIFLLRERGIRTILVNGRVSPRTARSYRKFRYFTRIVLDSLELCLMQTALDRNRLLEIGISPQKVRTAGNIKFDREWIPMSEEERREWLNRLNLDLKKSLWVAGSTHDGEEDILLDVFARLLPLFPLLHLIIAPRKIERSEDLRRLCMAKGLKAFLRTDLEVKKEPYDVLILNTIGELDRIYGIGRLCFVGGSLTPVGGHNLLEPASFGLPVLYGPYTHNFALMSQLLVESGGGKRVKDGEELFGILKELLSDPEKHKTMGGQAKAFVQMNQGALRRVMGYIEAYL
jgi:3-deoxy-D-manno-octulosonic-acid transferase